MELRSHDAGVPLIQPPLTSHTIDGNGNAMNWRGNSNLNAYGEGGYSQSAYTSPILRGESESSYYHLPNYTLPQKPIASYPMSIYPSTTSVAHSYAIASYFDRSAGKQPIVQICEIEI